jgi:hypothetical protein
MASCATKYKSQLSETSTHTEEMEQAGSKGMPARLYMQDHVCNVW